MEEFINFFLKFNRVISAPMLEGQIIPLVRLVFATQYQVQLSAI